MALSDIISLNIKSDDNLVDNALYKLQFSVKLVKSFEDIGAIYNR